MVLFPVWICILFFYNKKKVKLLTNCMQIFYSPTKKKDSENTEMYMHRKTNLRRMCETQMSLRNDLNYVFLTKENS